MRRDRDGRRFLRPSFHLYLLVSTLVIFFAQIPLGVFAAQSPLDTTAHVLLPAAATSLLHDLIYRRVVHGPVEYFCTMVFFGMGAETVWEVPSSRGDAAFGLSWQVDNADTMNDIMCGIAGAILGAAIRLYLWKRVRPGRRPSSLHRRRRPARPTAARAGRVRPCRRCGRHRCSGRSGRTRAAVRGSGGRSDWSAPPSSSCSRPRATPATWCGPRRRPASAATAAPAPPAPSIVAAGLLPAAAARPGTRRSGGADRRSRACRSRSSAPSSRSARPRASSSSLPAAARPTSPTAPPAWSPWWTPRSNRVTATIPGAARAAAVPGVLTGRAHRLRQHLGRGTDGRRDRRAGHHDELGRGDHPDAQPAVPGRGHPGRPAALRAQPRLRHDLGRRHRDQRGDRRDQGGAPPALGGVLPGRPAGLHGQPRVEPGLGHRHRDRHRGGGGAGRSGARTAWRCTRPGRSSPGSTTTPTR